MKFQSIILSLTVVAASVIYAQACTVFLNGTAYRSQTGNVGGGCFGLGGDNNITDVTTSNPGTKYTFFSDYGCKGTKLGHGTDKKHFDPPVKMPKSINITCPDST
ncbi:14148_t:CDS:2 [Ambispora leptoticha]|uniref:14148_t:CDS:1 n=1 Tax=Ambispora leptoticha TaxID=144679 RepID=A0A9N9AEP1_9GLOM|nr:14148_t:CDS:2 [Ambispora leptoticha]